MIDNYPEDPWAGTPYGAAIARAEVAEARVRELETRAITNEDAHKVYAAAWHAIETHDKDSIGKVRAALESVFAGGVPVQEELVKHLAAGDVLRARIRELEAQLNLQCQHADAAHRRLREIEAQRADSGAEASEEQLELFRCEVREHGYQQRLISNETLRAAFRAARRGAAQQPAFALTDSALREQQLQQLEAANKRIAELEAQVEQQHAQIASAVRSAQEAHRQLAQRADSGAEVSEAQARLEEVHAMGCKRVNEVQELLAARRGAAQQPAFALNDVREAVFAEVHHLCDDGAEAYSIAGRVLEHLAATPAPEQRPAAGWTVTDEDVRRVSDAGEVDYGSVRYKVRDALQEMLDLRRLTAPAAIEPLSEEDEKKVAFAESIENYIGNMQIKDLAAIIRRTHPRPAAPAAKAESVDDVLAEMRDPEHWNTGDCSLRSYANRLEAALSRKS